MIPRFAFVLLPALTITAWGQAPAKVQAPPEVEQALRARVNEFFQYHVDRGPALRKAMDLVAEDTKDYYYAAGKMEVKKFNITDVAFEEGLQKATVTLDVSHQAAFGTFAEDVTLPMSTLWKVEEGKWVWYRDASLNSITPMGLSNLSTMGNAPAAAGSEGPGIDIKDLADPKKLLQQAQFIMGQSKLDRTDVDFSSDKAGEESIPFHNAFFGAVILELQDIPKIPGLTIDLTQKTLGPQENSQIRFRYAPPSKDEKPAEEEHVGLHGAAVEEDAAAEPEAVQPRSASVRLMVLPFNREYTLHIHFDRPAADKAAVQQ